MKSGKKVYRQACCAQEPRITMRTLPTGDLRSLVLHIHRNHLGTEQGDYLLALAMCEITARFTRCELVKRRGKGKDL